MKVLYYDCFSGISGDMNLGVMVDLGVPKEYLIEMLNKLPINDEFKIEVNRKMKMGIEGTKVDVILTHKHHHHEEGHHSHQHEGHHHHHHHQRGINEIKNIIEASNLDINIKKRSLKMFMEVAKAEAKVHGKSIEEVHFHEVGAVDSIVDVVGAAIALEYLNVDSILSSPIELGGGFVKCEHGLIPVPAPATVEILRDVPVKLGKVEHETTTPTGAAILKANVDKYTSNPTLKIIKVGYGLGTKDFNIPNVLRAYIYETSDSSDIETSKEYLIEANIDDFNPELFQYVETKLFDNGALDVFKTSIIMKKSRLATKLSVLVQEKDCQIIENIIFRETSTFGMRVYPVTKKMLKRKFETIKTKYGEVNIKKGFINGELVKFKPEYEDCKKIALENNIEIKKVYELILNKNY